MAIYDNDGKARPYDHDIEATRVRLNQLAWLLDSSIPLPGVNFRIGVDALIGLIPGIGDLIGVALSSYIVREAARAGLPRTILARMVFNVAVEGVVGLVPFAGDVFDAGWKANQRNVGLLNTYLDNPRHAVKASRAFTFAMSALLVALLVVLGAGTFMLVRWAWQAAGL